MEFPFSEHFYYWFIVFNNDNSTFLISFCVNFDKLNFSRILPTSFKLSFIDIHFVHNILLQFIDDIRIYIDAPLFIHICNFFSAFFFISLRFINFTHIFWEQSFGMLLLNVCYCNSMIPALLLSPFFYFISVKYQIGKFSKLSCSFSNFFFFPNFLKWILRWLIFQPFS